MELNKKAKVAAEAKAKAKAKAKAEQMELKEKTTKVAAEAKAKAAAKAKAKAKEEPLKPKNKRPHYALEQTREQVMCRSGGTGPGSTHRITFKEAGSKQKAIAMAKVWVQKQLKKA